MRRALFVLVLALSVLVGCRPALETAATSSQPPSTSTTSTTLELDEPAFTVEEVRYLAAMAERDAAVAAFLEHVAYVRAAVPSTLRSVRWCEAGRYIGLPFGETNYAALNGQGSSASGGYQVLDSTWNGRNGQPGWKHLVAGAEVYSRAVHAPPWVQDAVATAAFARSGTTPWNASAGCWSRYVG